jgi:hypothetical protein
MGSIWAGAAGLRWRPTFAALSLQAGVFIMLPPLGSPPLFLLPPLLLSLHISQHVCLLKVDTGEQRGFEQGSGEDTVSECSTTHVTGTTAACLEGFLVLLVVELQRMLGAQPQLHQCCLLCACLRVCKLHLQAVESGATQQGQV